MPAGTRTGATFASVPFAPALSGSIQPSYTYAPAYTPADTTTAPATGVAPSGAAVARTPAYTPQAEFGTDQSGTGVQAPGAARTVTAFTSVPFAPALSGSIQPSYTYTSAYTPADTTTAPATGYASGAIPYAYTGTGYNPQVSYTYTTFDGGPTSATMMRPSPVLSAPPVAPGVKQTATGGVTSPQQLQRPAPSLPSSTYTVPGTTPGIPGPGTIPGQPGTPGPGVPIPGMPSTQQPQIPGKIAQQLFGSLATPPSGTGTRPGQTPPPSTTSPLDSMHRGGPLSTAPVTGAIGGPASGTGTAPTTPSYLPYSGTPYSGIPYTGQSTAETGTYSGLDASGNVYVSQNGGATWVDSSGNTYRRIGTTLVDVNGNPVVTLVASDMPGAPEYAPAAYYYGGPGGATGAMPVTANQVIQTPDGVAWTYNAQTGQFVPAQVHAQALPIAQGQTVRTPDGSAWTYDAQAGRFVPAPAQTIAAVSVAPSQTVQTPDGSTWTYNVQTGELERTMTAVPSTQAIPVAAGQTVQTPNGSRWTYNPETRQFDRAPAGQAATPVSGQTVQPGVGATAPTVQDVRQRMGEAQRAEARYGYDSAEAVRARAQAEAFTGRVSTETLQGAISSIDEEINVLRSTLEAMEDKLARGEYGENGSEKMAPFLDSLRNRINALEDQKAGLESALKSARAEGRTEEEAPAAAEVSQAQAVPTADVAAEAAKPAEGEALTADEAAAIAPLIDRAIAEAEEDIRNEGGELTTENVMTKAQEKLRELLKEKGLTLEKILKTIRLEQLLRSRIEEKRSEQAVPLNEKALAEQAVAEADRLGAEDIAVIMNDLAYIEATSNITIENKELLARLILGAQRLGMSLGLSPLVIQRVLREAMKAAGISESRVGLGTLAMLGMGGVAPGSTSEGSGRTAEGMLNLPGRRPDGTVVDNVKDMEDDELRQMITYARRAWKAESRREDPSREKMDRLLEDFNALRGEMKARRAMRAEAAAARSQREGMLNNPVRRADGTVLNNVKDMTLGELKQAFRYAEGAWKAETKKDDPSQDRLNDIIADANTLNREISARETVVETEAPVAPSEEVRGPAAPEAGTTPVSADSAGKAEPAAEKAAPAKTKTPTQQRIADLEAEREGLRTDKADKESEMETLEAKWQDAADEVTRGNIEKRMKNLGGEIEGIDSRLRHIQGELSFLRANPKYLDKSRMAAPRKSDAAHEAYREAERKFRAGEISEAELLAAVKAYGDAVRDETAPSPGVKTETKQPRDIFKTPTARELRKLLRGRDPLWKRAVNFVKDRRNSREIRKLNKESYIRGVIEKNRVEALDRLAGRMGEALGLDSEQTKTMRELLKDPSLALDQILRILGIDSTKAEVRNKLQKIIDEVKREVEGKVRSGASAKEIAMDGAIAVILSVFLEKGASLFGEQIYAGQMLADDVIIQLGTGEGKTFVSIVGLFLRGVEAKTGERGVVAQIVTTDALAKRDFDGTRGIFERLGMDPACVTRDMGVTEGDFPDATERQREIAKRKQAAYRTDVIYVAASTLAFDMLHDIRESSSGRRYIPADSKLKMKLYYANVDEIDNVVLDQALSDFILSEGQNVLRKGPAAVYAIADIIARQILREGGELKLELVDINGTTREVPANMYYIVDRTTRAIILTDEGRKAVGMLMGLLGGIVSKDKLPTPTMGQVMRALEAHLLYEKGVHYRIGTRKNGRGELIIVSEFTGRDQTGQRWERGLAQAVEMKESLDIQAESKTSAKISIRDILVNSFEHFSGLSGTITEARKELKRLFGRNVVAVPSHYEKIRDSNDTTVVLTGREKMSDVRKKISDIQAKKPGAPILVVLRSMNSANAFYDALAGEFREEVRRDLAVDEEWKWKGEEEIRGEVERRLKEKVQVLDAFNEKDEVTIVATAGRPGMITIATNIAGRATDIQLPGRGEMMDFAKDKAGLEAYNIEELGRLLDELNKDRNRSTREEKVKEIGNFFDMLEGRIGADVEALAELKTMIFTTYVYGLQLIREVNKSKRIDRQADGRSARQNNPGETWSVFSLDGEDLAILERGLYRNGDIIDRFRFNQIKSIIKEAKNRGGKLTAGDVEFIRKEIGRAQENIDRAEYRGRANAARFNTFEFKMQEAYHEVRNSILRDAKPSELFSKFVGKAVTKFVEQYRKGDMKWEDVTDAVRSRFGIDIKGVSESTVKRLSDGGLKQVLTEAIMTNMSEGEVVSSVTRAIDDTWVKFLAESRDARGRMWFWRYSRRMTRGFVRLMTNFTERVAETMTTPRETKAESVDDETAKGAVEKARNTAERYMGMLSSGKDKGKDKAEEAKPKRAGILERLRERLFGPRLVMTISGVVLEETPGKSSFAGTTVAEETAAEAGAEEAEGKAKPVDISASVEGELAKEGKPGESAEERMVDKMWTDVREESDRVDGAVKRAEALASEGNPDEALELLDNTEKEFEREEGRPLNATNRELVDAVRDDIRARREEFIAGAVESARRDMAEGNMKGAHSKLAGFQPPPEEEFEDIGKEADRLAKDAESRIVAEATASATDAAQRGDLHGALTTLNGLARDGFNTPATDALRREIAGKLRAERVPSVYKPKSALEKKMEKALEKIGMKTTSSRLATVISTGLLIGAWLMPGVREYLIVSSIVTKMVMSERFLAKWSKLSGWGRAFIAVEILEMIVDVPYLAELALDAIGIPGPSLWTMALSGILTTAMMKLFEKTGLEKRAAKEEAKKTKDKFESAWKAVSAEGDNITLARLNAIAEEHGLDQAQRRQLVEKLGMDNAFFNDSVELISAIDARMLAFVTAGDLKGKDMRALLKKMLPHLPNMVPGKAEAIARLIDRKMMGREEYIRTLALIAVNLLSPFRVDWDRMPEFALWGIEEAKLVKVIGLLHKNLGDQGPSDWKEKSITDERDFATAIKNQMIGTILANDRMDDKKKRAAIFELMGIRPDGMTAIQETLAEDKAGKIVGEAESWLEAVRKQPLAAAKAAAIAVLKRLAAVSDSAIRQNIDVARKLFAVLDPKAAKALAQLPEKDQEAFLVEFANAKLDPSKDISEQALEAFVSYAFNVAARHNLATARIYLNAMTAAVTPDNKDMVLKILNSRINSALKGAGISEEFNQALKETVGEIISPKEPAKTPAEEYDNLNDIIDNNPIDDQEISDGSKMVAL
ncbi:MAG: hypothetical protein WC515_08905, partial [Candidatus Omnitrophota bacterium]